MGIWVEGVSSLGGKRECSYGTAEDSLPLCTQHNGHHAPAPPAATMHTTSQTLQPCNQYPALYVDITSVYWQKSNSSDGWFERKARFHFILTWLWLNLLIWALTFKGTFLHVRSDSSVRYTHFLIELIHIVIQEEKGIKLHIKLHSVSWYFRISPWYTGLYMNKIHNSSNIQILFFI